MSSVWNEIRLEWGDLINKKVVTTNKSSKLSKMIAIIMLFTFLFCFIIMAVDSIGFYTIKNVDYFFQGFIFMLAFFSGYAIGDNSNKRQ